MNHISRAREQDLGPLVQRMSNAIEDALIKPWRESGRPQADLFLAGLLSLAVTARALRSAGDVPVEAWAEACRIAADTSSLTYTMPVLPAIHIHG